MSTLGERIKIARGTLSQDVFSSQIEVNKGSLGFYERDENIPKADVLLRITEKTEISIEWLMTGRGPMRSSATPQFQESHDRTPTLQHEVVVSCARCSELKVELEMEKAERREVSGENRRLWKENGDLRERCAKLEVR